MPLEHEQPVTIAHFSPEGRRLVTVAVDVARIWDVTTSQPVGFPLRHDDVIIAAAFSRDGGRVLTASNDRTVRVWNAATGRPLSAPLSHAKYVMRADFSPDGTRVATNLGADDPHIWRVLLDLSSPERIALAADLAEILGDHQVTALGSVAPLNESERLERMRRLAGPSATAFSPIDAILGRFADARR
jgi:WD40 repeat protein